MTEDEIDEMYSERVRTMSVLGLLLKGKYLSVGHVTLAMGEDMSVGFLYGGSVVSSMRLDELNTFLNIMDIGIVIPSP